MPTSSGVPPDPADPVAKLVDHNKFWLQASESVDGLGSLVKYKNEESPLSLKVSRVSQLDAELLDRELCDILKAKLFKGMAYFKVSPLMSIERLYSHSMLGREPGILPFYVPAILRTNHPVLIEYFANLL